MQRKTKPEPWTWIPANPPSRWPNRMLGAVVLAVTCLTMGVVIGRMSLADLGSRVQSQFPPAVAPAPPSQPQSAPLRAATASAETQPTMALKSDPEPEGQGTSAADSPPNPAVLLNPGTVKPRNVFTEEKAKDGIPTAGGSGGNATIVDQAADDSKLGNAASVHSNQSDGIPANSKAGSGAGQRTRRHRALANSRSARPSEQSTPDAPSPSASRDYQDLRAYMLAR